jgi:hypothetical protein
MVKGHQILQDILRGHALYVTEEATRRQTAIRIQIRKTLKV